VNSNQLLFRADKRSFIVGSVIQTAGEYEGKFQGAARSVEDSLELHRPPTKVARATSLFLYEDERCARKHWIYLTGGKLYRASISPSEIRHRADIKWMDLMKERATDSQFLKDHAAKYWAGEVTANPVIEVLVPSAIVVDVIADSEDERNSALAAYLHGTW
jgi:hypothetical protein